MAQLVNVLFLRKNTTFLSFSPHKYTELKITTQHHFLHIISYTLVPNMQEYFVLAYMGKVGVSRTFLFISLVHMKNYHTASGASGFSGKWRKRKQKRTRKRKRKRSSIIQVVTWHAKPDVSHSTSSARIIQTKEQLHWELKHSYSS